jgi:hypothetical protein
VGEPVWHSPRPMPHLDRCNETVTTWARGRDHLWVPAADRRCMERAGLSWGGRGQQEGVVGPFTCERCQWSGTFWLFAVDLRRSALRWLGLGLRHSVDHVLICRNCAYASAVTADAAPALVDSAGPVLAADPLGPQPVAETRGTWPSVG